MIDPNGPAFPSSDEDSDSRNPGWTGRGLTIRAHFASMAMQGMCGSFLTWRDESGNPCMATQSPEKMAAIATGYADALVAELNK